MPTTHVVQINIDAGATYLCKVPMLQHLERKALVPSWISRTHQVFVSLKADPSSDIFHPLGTQDTGQRALAKRRSPHESA